MNEQESPSQKDSSIAIALSQIAKDKAMSMYSEFYKKKRFKIKLSECIIPDEIFLKILNDCLILSQQKIEERSISTKLLFPSLKNGLLDWPEGVKFIPIDEFSFPSIDLGNLKKYLEIASDINTYLVVDLLENSNDKSAFTLKGFVFVENSINKFVFKYKQKSLSNKQDDLMNSLGCLYSSVIFSVKSRKVSVSYLDQPFLIIEKCLISQDHDFTNETFYISHYSRGFREKLKIIIGKDLNDLSLEETKKIINGEIEMDKLLKKNTYIQTLIDNYVAESLKNIFLKISEARHGSTLIFNFKGDIDNKELFQPDAIKINIPYGSTLLKLAELKEPKLIKMKPWT